MEDGSDGNESSAEEGSNGARAPDAGQNLTGDL